MGIKIGLVGLGSFGSAFAGLFTAHPLVDKIALCDREPERVDKFAQNPLFQTKLASNGLYYDFADICKADLDALVIITQPWLHAEQTVQAMQHGKHVYSAVPIVSLPDGDEILEWCDKLIRSAESTGMSFMLGETTYYRPEAVYCRQRAAKGDFGVFTHSEGWYLHDSNSPTSNLYEVQRRRLASKSGQEWVEKAKEYARRNIISGPMHYPTHSVSGPMAVMNAYAKKVSCWAFSSDGDFMENEYYNETALFQMSNKTTMLIKEHRQAGHPNEETFSIYGTEGSYVANSWRDRSRIIPLTEEQMRPPLPDDIVAAFKHFMGETGYYGGHGGSHAYLVHEFVDAIASGRQPAVNAWDAVRYMAAGVTAHKSALQDGLILDVPDWGDGPAK